jgi:branched-chain amino acid transport system permease protein
MTAHRKWAALVCILLVLLPWSLSDFWIFIALEVLAFALYAMSFNLLLGFGGMLSFGHAAFFGVGAYSAAIFFKRSGLDVEWMFTLAPLVAMGVSAAMAGLIGYFSIGFPSQSLFHILAVPSFACSIRKNFCDFD